MPEHIIHEGVRLYLLNQRANNHRKQVTKLGAYIIVSAHYWGFRTPLWVKDTRYQFDRYLERGLNILLERMYSTCNAVERMRWRASDRQWRYEVGA